MSENANYIVYAPAYDPNSGGSIFLHELVHALNEFGETAYLWPWNTPPKTNAMARVSKFFKKLGKNSFNTKSGLNTPIATESDLGASSIVIYPEVTLGNPLGAKNIVRWLLYKPGVKDPYEFTEGETFVCAGKMSDIPEITGGAPELFLWRRHAAYRNDHRPDRKGACYLVRKGADKPRIAETEDAVQIDGLSHEEIAEIFNQSEVFYSYDEASFYSQYAAICGCLSVIVPGIYSSREEWVKNHELGRFGIAYGISDLEHAKSTAHRVEELLKAQEDEGLRTVSSFIEMTKQRFGS